MKFLLYWLFRKETLCSGEKICPDALLQCIDCGRVRPNLDFQNPGACPNPDCGSYSFEYIRCSHCFVSKLDKSLEYSAWGVLIQEALEVNEELQLKLRLSSADIRADVFQVLLLLASERDAYLEEKRPKTPGYSS